MTTNSNETRACKFYITDKQDAFLDRFLPGQRTAVIKMLIDSLMACVGTHEAINGRDWLNIDDFDFIAGCYIKDKEQNPSHELAG